MKSLPLSGNVEMPKAPPETLPPSPNASWRGRALPTACSPACPPERVVCVCERESSSPSARGGNGHAFSSPRSACRRRRGGQFSLPTTPPFSKM